jgi:1-acyl-sn-glycerol-3-phosphate acyltransferase
MLYAMLRLLVRAALRVFFRQVAVKGLDRLPSRGPLLVAANHPNTFMDPMAIAAYLRQPVYFLANGALFRNPWVARLMRLLHMVPIYRKQDLRPGEQADNEAVFEQCFAFLKEGGTLMIFPEGSSVQERKLRPLKTGAARIALGAAARYGFGLPVQVAAVGLHYSAPSRFRSELVIDAAEPLAMPDWQARYEADPDAAVKALTQQLALQLASHTVVAHTPGEERLLEQLAGLLQTDRALQGQHDRAADRYGLEQQLAQALAYAQQHWPERFERLSRRISAYYGYLGRLGLSDAHVAQGGDPGWKSGLLHLALGMPLHIFGVLHHYLPYKIPYQVAKAITHEVEYHAPIMMLAGMAAFPTSYALYAWAAFACLPPVGAALYLLALPAAGFYALHYWGRWTAARQYGRLRAVGLRRPAVAEGLVQYRKNLMNELNTAKHDYLDATGA